MKLSLLLKRQRETVLHEGILRLWSRILWHIEGTVHRRILLMERSLDEPVPETGARVPVVFDELKETKVDDYLSLRRYADPSQIRSRLGRGHRCFVARHAGQIVHAAWASTSSADIRELARQIKLAPDEVFIYDVFTSPRFRGQGVSPARSAWMLSRFRAAGFRRAIAHVGPDNRASIRALEKAGYRSFGVMGYTKLGPWKWEFFRRNTFRGLT